MEKAQCDGQVVHRASAAAIFIGWYLPSTTPQLAPDEHVEEHGRGEYGQRDDGGPAEGADGALAPEVPGREGQHDDGPGDQRCQDHVRVGPQEHRIGEQRPDVGKHGLVLGVHHVAHGVLHPRVRRHDEQGRQHGGTRHQPDTGQVQFLRESVPPEDPNAQEGGFEEEGRETLHGQGTSEDVAHEAGVVRPVHSELELLDQPGYDADGHVDQQQGPEELRQPLERGIVVAIPAGLEQRDQERQSDGHRHEEEVVDAGGGELPSGEVGAHGVGLPSGSGAVMV